MRIQNLKKRFRWLICGWFLFAGVSCGNEKTAGNDGFWNCGGDSPVIAAHYMPWFNNPETGADAELGWKHWGWQGAEVQHSPEIRKENGLRDIAATKYPLIGPYSSNSDAVIRYHLETAKAAGIQVLIVIWYGPGSETDRVIPTLLDLAEATGIRISLAYEEKINWPPFRNPGSRSEIVKTATEDLSYLLERFASHPAYLRRVDEPVIFQFNYWGEGDLGKQNILPEEWTRIFDQLPAAVSYVRQNNDEEYHPPIGARYLWFTKDEHHISHFAASSRERIEEAKLDFFVTMAAPEFNDSGVNGWGNGSRITPGEGLSLFKDTFERASQDGPEMIQLVTWNDFNEGTSIEPTLENGFQYLDAFEVWLGEKTGRTVNLDDNRIPFRRYLEQCSEAEKREVPARADEVANRVSDLSISIPHYLETFE
jgi:sugar phosphate isomerase/epimerase